MRRSAFTLLEMLVSLALSLILLAALYVALDLQFRLSETGRLLTQHSTLARSLLSRISNDVTGTMGPPDAGRLLPPTSLTGQTTSQTTQTAPTTGTGTGATQPTTQTTQTAETTQTATTFSLAIQGDAERLTIFITRLPQSGRPKNTSDPNGTEKNSDVRRITYWLAGGIDPMGLAKQEVMLITSDDATMQPEDVGDESSFVIAEEVKSLSFQYFDGTNWMDTWDGTALPSNATVDTTTTTDTSTTGTTASTTASNNLPVGPPLAIKITIGLPNPNGNGELKYYPHVVAIPTANGIR